ncbi:DoxX family protein [Oculatella sp. FACHB-28]|uniref:DoxX family protein n=1 Tax=Oculatella sp. FACHB-28 TaxID=2692845 RepID=UPI0016837D72|nr:DoxX family protein [Oculatella sp. FACHB-28]MBD2054688.1 DoxX family protein [Oculatella sp. FACHB-28]
MTQYLPTFLNGLDAWALLGLRVTWGSVLVMYSFPMAKNPFHWMDMGGKPSGFPGLLQALGALSVLGGGIAIIAGFLTPLAALGLVGAMLVALFLHLVQRHPFVKPAPDAPGESYDNSLLYLAIAILFIFLGPGSFSLDSIFFVQ